MAKVSFTLPIDEIRGKLGGLVFSANKSGAYVKPFRQPAYVINENIQVQRVLLSTIPSAWRALTSDQRTAWNAWAAAAPQARTDSLGNTYYVNGYQQYSRIATHRFNLLSTLPTAAPTIAIPAAPTINAFEAYYPQDGTYYCAVTFAVGSFGAGDYVMVDCAASPTQYATAMYSGFRKILYFTTPGVTPAKVSLRYPVADFFGDLIVGGQLFVRCYRTTTECVPSLPAVASAVILDKP